jgi:ATP-binding cassette subfamily A (ABC1) protein 3
MLWKNLILQIRRPIGTVFELAVPPLSVLVVVILRLVLFVPEERCFRVFQPNFLNLGTPTVQLTTVYYTPNTTEHNELAQIAQGLLSGTQFVGVSSESHLTSLARERRQTSSSNPLIQPSYIGVILPAALNTSELSIVIRPRHEVGTRNTWFTRRTGPTFSTTGPRTTNYYTSEGFVDVQNAITRAAIILRLNQSEISDSFPQVILKQLPFPKYTTDIFLSSVVSLLPTLLVLSYLYSGGVFVKELVLEKETRLRESMKMMGLKPSALFSAWFLKQFLFLMITGTLGVILIKFGRIFPSSGFFMLLVFFIIYFIASIAFGYMISTFFTSARLSMYVGFILFFVSFVPYFFLFPRLDQIPLIGKIAASLLFNTGAGLGFNIISSLELTGEGLQWSNVATRLSAEDSLTVAILFAVLLLDACIYFLIGWYKEAVFPGKYGVPKPFYFPFLPSYWLGRPLRKKSVFPSATNELADLRMEANNFEQEPVGLNCGIKIRNMTKIYQRCCRKQKVAVNDLSLNMYEGQITALLGHNGAGKTTTMSVLTGLYTPTSGDAVINGYSILTDMDEIRKNLGLCPQHNVLFERLTVKEHLMLFGMLKGASWQELKRESTQLIQDLQIEDKTKTIANNLSGGMKRKLSVGIALIGGSKFVILDEPTSGMDPYARRSTWDLLGKYKKNRTILLTTHHMDEADILGDRIAIMAEGKLLTSGSSLFLKSRFGVGYHLTMVKGRDASSERICEVVMSTIDGAEKVGDVAGELSFVLPSHLIDHYPKLFDKLEG